MKSDDILFVKTGGAVGKSYFVQEIPEEAMIVELVIHQPDKNVSAGFFILFR
ncbi:hypothetical protein [Gallibacter sp. Marseille-QA0791]|uniref:hypothetical protein n=1 Tax=Gallibacter sp. Marseille-QA0791 TaxID=3378781 RepID=UPI003D146155